MFDISMKLICLKLHSKNYSKIIRILVVLNSGFEHIPIRIWYISIKLVIEFLTNEIENYYLIL